MSQKLELHVWGPAFGLPSIDAECVATIAFCEQRISPTEYKLLQSSPSAVPTQRLPALYNPISDTWTSGFSDIVAHLQSCSGGDEAKSSYSPSQRADGAAYTTFLTAHAAPLLALSLYVSSANWAETTRPAYSAILPMPLPWTEPSAVRAAMARRAEHLGMSSLDTDAAEEAAAKTEEAGLAAGWVHVPAALRRPKKTVKDSLIPEQRSRIRLEGLATDVYDVLAEADWENQTTEARCLAFAYLALMLKPDVPRPWLSEVMRRRYQPLCEFVEEFSKECFENGSTPLLPWGDSAANSSALGVASRFTKTLLHDVPGLGDEWQRWSLQRQQNRQREKNEGVVVSASSSSSNDLLLMAGTSITLAAVGAGAWFYRSLPPFGAPVQTWVKPLTGLGAFGAAGVMFSMAAGMANLD
ncbi:Metaxin-1 [Diplogelasinospora grovesii]|uniref:Metaxin-1 n=1 Tax=Diplogelasinospora grovesii TaxID=303347 RepID=A0AAN6N4Z3_9PEZI|nr:Metaxin-1 [Diplogelasinospora grovesii]